MTAKPCKNSEAGCNDPSCPECNPAAKPTGPTLWGKSAAQLLWGAGGGSGGILDYLKAQPMSANATDVAWPPTADVQKNVAKTMSLPEQLLISPPIATVPPEYHWKHSQAAASSAGTSNGMASLQTPGTQLMPSSLFTMHKALSSITSDVTLPLPSSGTPGCILVGAHHLGGLDPMALPISTLSSISKASSMGWWPILFWPNMGPSNAPSFMGLGEQSNHYLPAGARCVGLVSMSTQTVMTLADVLGMLGWLT